ncbi:hypothetical protein [Paracoccus tegillarcae]|uniref:Uncharacterized protein n=1 Tax=Paracoccus tegillarcae TaxID=1529068 RepID=A0A2K9EQ36_9RHOB|nr:hypothetical protein [Paracoccus tegillarcae]AUH33775.1 hypothetical protein CUV01_10585 [Paracoccus tegillarcae]
MLNCVGANWRPIIGDPTIFGWITVVAYLICAILAVIVWNSRPEPALRRFWAFSAIVLAFLALNKQLDLQTAMTSTGRCLFHYLDIYEQRSFVQLIFVIVLIAVVFLLYLRGMSAMRRYRRSHGLAMLGLGFVALYVLIRATSFHVVDLLGSQQVFGISANFLLENAGLVMIAINAIGLLTGWIVPERQPKRPRNMRARPRQASAASQGRGPVFASGGIGASGPNRPGKGKQGKPAGPRFPVEPLDH